jgi:hypothetical protein
MMQIRPLAIAILATFTVCANAQTLYKYSDENGRTVYTDDPRQAGNAPVQTVPQRISAVEPARLGAMPQTPAPATIARADVLPPSQPMVTPPPQDTAARAVEPRDAQREVDPR